MNKILFINPFGIGDVLFTTGVIKAIKESLADSSIGYWCNERVQEIFRNNPRVDKVFSLSRGDLKKIYRQSKIDGVLKSIDLLLKIRKEKYDAVIDFSLDYRYGLTAAMLGIRKRVGFNYKNRGRFLTDRIDIDGYSGKHVADYYLGLLDFFDIKPITKGLEVFASENDKIKSRIILDQAGIKESDTLIAMAPGAGASWGENAALKHWPPLKYAQLADIIMGAFDSRVLILGDISEKPLADVIVSAMKHKAVDLTGKLNLGELIAVLNYIRLLVTNDGGPLHIAAASGVRTVSIFGPVDDAVYGPYPAGPAHIVLKSQLTCRPCYNKFKMDVCERDKECLTSITVEEVFKAVKKLL